MTIGQDTVVELYLNEVWTDISAYVRADPGAEIRFGIRGEAGTADPSECSIVVNNTDGRFTPKNAAGAWYGYIKRGVPLRLTHDAVVRFVGEVSEFPARWDPTGNDVWVPLLASGVTRRLLRSSALTSTLRSYLSRQGVADGGTVTGYWPMEDEVGATVFASGLGSGGPMTWTGTPVLQAIDGGLGSGLLPKVAGVQAFGAADMSDDEFTVGFLVTMPTGGTTNGASLLTFTTNGTAALWELRYETGGAGIIRVRAYTAAGVLIDDTLAANLLLDGATRYVTLEAQQNGANVDLSLSSSGVGSLLDTYNACTITSPGYLFIGGGAGVTGDVGVGHVLASKDNQTLFNYDFPSALTGYTGESVEDRIERVGDLAGVAVAVVDDGTVSTYLGPQPAGSPLDVIREAELADAGGIFRDSLNVVNSVAFITRRARYNDATPTLELDYAAGHLTPPVDPTDDDQLLANDVTVVRTGGSSARAVDVTSPLNSLPWPDGIGPYEETATLNVQADSMLADLASWLLTLGTIDETRFPVLTVDLVRNPSLTAAVDLLRPGYMVTVENLPDFAGGGDMLVLHVLGWTERIGTHHRSFQLNCTPASPYDVVRLNDTIFARLDSATTVTNETLDTTETGVDFTGDTWVTTAANPSDFPFSIVIGGEEMTVTSATATTFTVTRSANGVVKSHASGVPVRLARPMRLAL